MTQPETYTMSYVCTNCGEEFEEEIQKGIRAKNHTEVKCPYCGTTNFKIGRKTHHGRWAIWPL